jgi:hypothetical protein
VSCVPLAKVSRQGRVDGALLGRARGLLLQGKARTHGKSRSLALTLEDRPGHVVGRYTFSLGRNRLSSQAMERLLGNVQDALGGEALTVRPLQGNPLPRAPGRRSSTGSAGPKAPPPAPDVRVGGRTETAVPAGQPGLNAPASAPGAAGAPQDAPATMSPEEAAAKKRKTPLPFVAVEAGLGGVGIDHAYENQTSQNLRGYNASFALVPRFRVEAYPGVRFTDGWLRGFGLELEYQRSVGLSSSLEGGPDHPTGYYGFDVLAKYRWEPFSFPLRVEPLAGYRVSSFKVEPVGGEVIAGLPELSYDGPELGIAAEYPFEPFTVLARARFLPLMAAGEILSTSYFREGSLWGLDLELGAGYRIWKQLSVRGVLEYTRYRYAFRPQPGDVFQATGATSQYTGGRVMLRYEFQ